jgi:hypothetical protein
VALRAHKSATTRGLVWDEFVRYRTLHPPEDALVRAKLAALSTIADTYPSPYLRSAIRDVCDIAEDDL